MTILYEPVCWGPEHSPVNAALVATVQAAFPGEPVTFFAEPGHLESVRNLLSGAVAGQVQWRELSIPPRSATGFRTRFPMDRQIAAGVLSEAVWNSCRRVIACANTASGIAALKWSLLKHPTALRVAMVHHTGLASLLGSRSTRALLRWRNGNNVRHIVLGDWIRSQVLQMVPSLRKSLFSIWHPYLFDRGCPRQLSSTGIMRFGFVGAGTQGKGFDRFCNLALGITASAGKASTRTAGFELVGRPLKDSGAICSAVSYPALKNGFMQRELFDERMNELHYTVFPFPPSSYDMIASGSFLDTFAYLKPCITLRHPMVEVYFKRMGDIGYICDSDAEMRELVASLLQDPPLDRYQRQCENLLRGRQVLDPSAVAVELQLVFA